MPNIHTLSDYRNNSSSSSPPPYRAAPAQPYPNNNNPSRVNTIAGLRPLQSPSVGGASGYEVGYAYEPGKSGISLMRPIPHDDGSPNTLLEQCCPRMELRKFTTLLSVVQIIIFIAELIVGSTKYNGAFVSGNDMGGPGICVFYLMGGKATYDIYHGNVWRLFTPIFLHAGILHILGNLWFQLRLGYTLEERWGWWRFALVYFLGGIGASLWSAVISPDSVSVGASGAIFGITGADIVYLAYNYIEIPDNRTEACFLGIVTVINFIFGAVATGIDNWAHFGGLMSGLPLGIMFVPLLVKRDNENIFRIVAGVIFVFEIVLFCGLLWGGGEKGGRISC